MGFGFNLFIVFIFFPMMVILTITIGIIWLVTKRKLFGIILACIWLPVIALILIMSIVHFFTVKKRIKVDDIYGEYIIDRSKFPGKQADWQYNHFRFEITPKNEILFHVTEKEKIIKTYSGSVTFIHHYMPRLVLHMKTDTNHHVIDSEPTLYRTVWGFYYVFNSSEFGNVFFTKGHWKSID